MKYLAGLASVTMQMVVGYLEPEAALQARHKIERMLSQATS